jgi:hypothetical protein
LVSGIKAAREAAPLDEQSIRLDAGSRSSGLGAVEHGSRSRFADRTGVCPTAEQTTGTDEPRLRLRVGSLA